MPGLSNASQMERQLPCQSNTCTANREDILGVDLDVPEKVVPVEMGLQNPQIWLLLSLCSHQAKKKSCVEISAS